MYTHKSLIGIKPFELPDDVVKKWRIENKLNHFIANQRFIKGAIWIPSEKISYISSLMNKPDNQIILNLFKTYCSIHIDKDINIEDYPTKHLISILEGLGLLDNLYDDMLAEELKQFKNKLYNEGE